ncbi:hypothetical protein CSOJ01_02938 [Colletotrichum sojae]|uniref:Uncharacterized protein n=1 Tax=Colletotrichum sojae TaxID=2175907 RepID=A0A8H6N1Z3_9PEZI|nr:hypothetical protein CSOJ01_02938 [Colletotrichum sojae]
MSPSPEVDTPEDGDAGVDVEWGLVCVCALPDSCAIKRSRPPDAFRSGLGAHQPVAEMRGEDPREALTSKCSLEEGGRG